jgi:hypothetical protein
MNNSDRLYKPNELTDDKIKEFSEGSTSLYRLLKYCYDNHIPTHACCKGHEGSISKPYISFYVINKEQMSSLIEDVMNNYESESFVCQINNYDNIKLGIYCLDLEKKDYFFDLITNSLKSSKNNSDYYKLFELNDYLLDYGSDLLTIDIHNEFIEISNPIYKKLIIQNGKEIYTNDKPSSGDMVYQVNNRKFYLPDDVDDVFVKEGEIIRDSDIFKSDINLQNSIIIENEFIEDFYDKIYKRSYQK